MKKTLLKISLTVSALILFGAVIMLPAAAAGISEKSQDARALSVKESVITLNMKAAGLLEILDAIESKTGYKFTYDKSELDRKLRIDLEFENKPVEDVLLEISKQGHLKFRQVNNNIHVKKLDPEVGRQKRIEVVIQTRNVTGAVISSEDNAPIPGVNVIEKGTINGTVTDIEGRYSLDVAEGATLIFSFVGFESREAAVGSQSVIDIVMSLDVRSLEEIVVVGYGEMRERDLTSSITTIRSEDIARTPASQPMQSLQGKVAGLQVVSSGAPGNSPTVRVRGIGSYPGASNTDPLYVVDGMFFDNIDFLNPSDIATISILKDASASAIYGVRAANGVVLIETKSGEFGQKAQISYDGYYGYQVAQNILQMANAEQFTAMALESGSPADIANIQSAMQRFGRSRINPNVPDANTDWYHEIIRPGAIQNHSLSAMGGSQNSSYSISASYFNQEGILDMKNEYERLNLRTKLDYEAADWFTIGGNMNVSSANKYSPDDAAWSQAYWAVPILPVYDETNEEAWPVRYASAEHIGFRNGQNPFPTLQANDDFERIRKLLANIYIKVDLVPDKLSFKTTYNNASTVLNIRNVDLPYLVSEKWKRDNASIVKKNESYINHIWDNTLTFNQTFGDHNLMVMAGSSFRDESYEMLTAKALDFPVANKKLWYIDKAQEIVVEEGVNRTVTDDGRRMYGQSYFGRIAYNYNDKYLFYGTFRADGNNKYQEKWGYFPTIGLGWVVTEETFMKGIPGIDFLKLRASWGEQGNDKVPASDGAKSVSIITTAIDDQLTTGTVATNTFAYNGWEVIEELNLGATARLLKDRLSLDADYFIRDTKNAVIPVYIPFAAVFVNRDNGVIRNSGFELALNWDDRITDNFSYSLGANIATLKNEVRDLYGQPYIDGGSAEFRQRSIVGEPLLAFFGYEVAGVYQNDEEIQADPIAIANSLSPGDFRYKDQNNDNVIDANDRVVLGSYFPSFTFGVNLGITWRDLDFSANIMGQTGASILNRKRGEIIWTPDLNMDADLAKNRWHGEGTSNQYPSSAGLRKGWNQKMSDYFVEDGSFFRIQNLQLGYTVKPEFLGTSAPSARVFLTAERPLTLFKYNGFNPEVADGIDRQTYPIPAVYTVGLNVNF